MKEFTYKGYGRIYVQNAEDIQKVEQILHEKDQFEFEDYYPGNLVTTLDRYPSVIYIGKFTLNFDLEAECKKQNIPIFIFDSGREDCPRGYYPTQPLTKNEILNLMVN